jgi:hypothetical protein
MTRTLVYRIYGFVFALLLCATVVGAASQVARSDNGPPHGETPLAWGSHDQLEPLW